MRLITAERDGYFEKPRCSVMARRIPEWKIKRTQGGQSADYSLEPLSSSTRSSCAIRRMSSVIFMEQYLGPHMLQK
jgi:hypothetical protein